MCEDQGELGVGNGGVEQLEHLETLRFGSLLDHGGLEHPRLDLFGIVSLNILRRRRVLVLPHYRIKQVSRGGEGGLEWRKN